MAREILIDTSGFYALLNQRDSRHERAKQILSDAAKERRRFVTTDYVLDETATLLKGHGAEHLVEQLFRVVQQSAACRIEWTDMARFEATQRLFIKHLDHAWSFTDCLSFVVMKELRLRDALTSDEHFREAGFHALLATSGP
jgi:hypothetical protein